MPNTWPRWDSMEGKWLAVALIAASPVGEELVSIPAGWGMGLPLGMVALVSVLFNFAPVPVLLWLIGRMEGHPWISRFIGWFRKERVTNFARKYGYAGIAMLAPVTGVYAMTVAAWALGMARGSIMLFTAIGLVLYAIGTCGVILFGKAVYAMVAG